MGKRIDFEVSADAARNAGNCRACGAEIVWRRTHHEDGTPRGWMPLDVSSAQPTLDGGFRMESHHAHCPSADRFRRRSR